MSKNIIIKVIDESGNPVEDVYVELTYSVTDRITLNMKPLEKFNNAAGPITVVYSGGYLMGEGGPVEPFEETFVPTDLIMKPNQMVRERLELSDISIDAQVIPIIYTDVSNGREQLQLSDISITAEVIPIDDI